MASGPLDERAFGADPGQRRHDPIGPAIPRGVLVPWLAVLCLVAVIVVLAFR